MLLQDQVRQLASLCDRGMFLQGLSLVEALEVAAAPRAVVMAARALRHLGAPRLADARCLRLWRNQPDVPEVQLSYLRLLASRYGPRRAWLVLENPPRMSDWQPAIVAEWHSLAATIYGGLRDFTEASRCHSLARKLAPDDPWIRVEWSSICEARDDYVGALEAAEEALAIQPGFRAAESARAHVLTLLRRDDEALAHLEYASQACESADLVAQLLMLHMEREQHATASALLDRYEQLTPRADKITNRWVIAMRARLCLLDGNRASARVYASQLDDPFHAKLAARLSDETISPTRVLLRVGFVRQHHLTCAPATLTALAEYWQRPVDHLDVVEQICYDGTSWHNERAWAEAQGFDAREFTVDWPTARALIDAGVPFTLTTQQTGSGHLQSVIGYDAVRDTLLIRDPFERIHGEFDAQALIESHASSGPRGMLLLPPTESARLANIILPEEALWTIYYQAQTALTSHDRETAARLCTELATNAPGHRLAHNAGRSLAWYDGNEPEALRYTEALLERWPDDSNLQLAKAGSLASYASLDEQLAWLRKTAARPSADPLVRLRLAQTLGLDGRLGTEARREVNRTLRVRPGESQAWRAVADIDWEEGARDLAVREYRVAACLGETIESQSEAYFRAAYFTRRSEEGVAFLRERCERLGTRSFQPWATLFNQLERLERTPEAFEVLNAASEQRPGDPDAVLFTAERHLYYGRTNEAARLLESIVGPARKASVMRLKAQIARDAGELALAAEHAGEACRLEPLSVDMHRLLADCLLRLSGRQAVIAALEEACRRFPAHWGLHQLHYEWLSDEPLGRGEALLRHMIARHPTLAWSQRELATLLARQGQFVDARRYAEEGIALAPAAASSYTVAGFVARLAGDIAAARNQYREAVAHSADDAFAVRGLIGACSTLVERREEFDYIFGQMLEQVLQGDGLLALLDAGTNTLAPGELLVRIRDAHAARPDLWQAWCALIIQLVEAHRFEEAVETAALAIERFPFVPRMHIEKGRAHSLLKQHQQALDCYREALRINPGAPLAARLYALAVSDMQGDLGSASQVLEIAGARNPEDATLKAARASVLYRLGSHEEALQLAVAAALLAPAVDQPWDVLASIAASERKPEVVARASRELTRLRPQDALAWWRRARTAPDHDEAMRACEVAVRLEPRNLTVFEFRLALLMRARRFDDIAREIASSTWGERPPASVRLLDARAGWQRGDADGAIERLRALLAQDENFYGGWLELCEWLDATQQKEALAEAASHLVRIAPYSATAWGNLAYAEGGLGRKEAAHAHCLKAHALDPTYTFAINRLVDYALEAGDLVEAGRVLGDKAASQEHPSIALRRLKLARHRGILSDAGDALKVLLTEPNGQDFGAEPAFAEMARRAWELPALEIIEACIREGRCISAGINYWIKSQNETSSKAFRSRVDSLLKEDPGRVLMNGLIQHCGETRDGKLLAHLVDVHREALRADTPCWSQVGYAYLRCGALKLTTAWMADWESRPDAPWWALDNAAYALRALDRAEAARPLSMKSLELNPQNQDAMLWLACDAAVAGNLAQLTGFLGRISVGQVRPIYQHIHVVLTAFHDAVRHDDSSRAIAGFRATAARNRMPLPLQRLRRRLRSRLLRYHTPAMLTPWRWAQLA